MNEINLRVRAEVKFHYNKFGNVLPGRVLTVTIVKDGDSIELMRKVIGTTGDLFRLTMNHIRQSSWNVVLPDSLQNQQTGVEIIDYKHAFLRFILEDSTYVTIRVDYNDDSANIPF